MNHFMSIKYFGSVALAFLILSIPTAGSARSNGSITCSLATTPLLFGEYIPHLGTPLDFTATITVTCTTSGVATERWYGTISLTGTGASSSRQLKQGSHPLEYQLYLDPARTLAWGSGGGERNGLPVSGVVGPSVPYRQSIVVYGRIPALQISATVGRYTDQITAVLDY